MFKKNKITIIVFLLVLSLCLMLASCNKGDSVLGKYYEEKADGTLNESSWIELMKKNKWQDDEGSSGTYEINGKTIKFFIDGEEWFDGTIEDGVMVLEIFEQIIFRKEAAKNETPTPSPKDPDKDPDEGPSEPTITEYNVEFNLNYGDNEIVTKSTEEGLIAFLPMREGYVFNGWWISSGLTESGPILSQKWDMTSAITESGIILYAEWVEEKELQGQLNAPSVSINDRIFSWDAVEGAASYTVKLFSGSEELSSKIQSQTSWTFPTSQAAGYYSISIRANGDGENSYNSTYISKSYAHKVLSKITSTDFSMATSMLTWTHIIEADYYSLTVGGTQVIANTTTTAYDMSYYNVGSHTIVIYAHKSGYISSSTSFSINKRRLPPPQPITVSLDADFNNVISWPAVPYADTYRIYINEEETFATTKTESYTIKASSSKWLPDHTMQVYVCSFDKSADYLVSSKSEVATLTERMYFATIAKNIDTAGTIYIDDTEIVYGTGDASVSFNLKGGSGEAPPTQYAAQHLGLVYPPIPVRSGYIFGGWYTNSACTGAPFDFSSNVISQITLYAKWLSPTGYTSTIATGGSVTNIAFNTTIKYYAYVPLVSESITIYSSHSSGDPYGYLYNSSKSQLTYNDNSQGNNDFKITYSVTAGELYYIGYKSYDSSSTGRGNLYISGTATPKAGGLLQKEATHKKAVAAGSSITLTAETYLGYTWLGWYDGTKKVSEGDSLSYTLNMTAKNKTLQARWELKAAMSNLTFTSTQEDCQITGLIDNEVANVAIPDFVTSIGPSAFADCSATITWGANPSVSAIGSNAFSEYQGTSITIPDSVITIGSSAFGGCSSLTSITLPFVGGSKDTSAASSSTLFGYIFGTSSYSGGVYTRQYYNSSSSSTYYIPSSLKEVTITGGNILYGAFYSCSNLTSITIPNSVTSIGSNAFYDCKKLTSITIPNSVTSIGSSAFSGCSGLSGVYISDIAAWCNISFNSTSANPLYYAKKLYLNGELATTITIPNSITSIGSYAFENCTSLTSITIPNSVATIGSSAFSGCSSLTSITLPFVGSSKNASAASSSTLFGYIFGTSSYSGGVSTEQYYKLGSSSTYYIPSSLKEVTITEGNMLYGAFYGCSGLTSIIIPNSVKSIGDSAFYGCSGLTSITIPNSVTSIGSRAFWGCTNLTSIIIPNSVTSINHGAFYGCSGLTSIIIPNSVKSIGGSAFEDCTSLTSITIGNSVTSIGDSAFYGCSGLTSITIPNSVTSIDVSAFYGCSGLTSITIPDSVIAIGSSAFSGCNELTSINVADENTAYKSIDGVLFNKSETILIQYPASKTGVGYNIPDGVASIDSRAFRNCTGLTSITIPDSVTTIGSSVFSGCSALTSITLPFVGGSKNASAASSSTLFGYIFATSSYEGGVSIEQYYSGSYLKTFYIPSSLKEVTITGGNILYGAFYNCSGLTSITISSSVTSIGERAFYGCSGLTSVTIGNSVTSISSYAFHGCSSLARVNISDIAAWCNIAFGDPSANPLYYAKKLYLNGELMTSVTIPDSVIAIGDRVFSDCSGLTSVIIGNSVTSIGDSAFADCSGLTSVIIGNSVTSIGDSAFAGCSGLTSIIIPDSVTSIGRYAFRDCSSLTSITIPNSVTSIGSWAFWGCTSLTIYARAASKPSGWYSNWNYSNRPVVWGYTGD